MNNEKKKVIEFENGEVYLWVEQGSAIMLKAVTKEGDPVELFSKTARELAETLLKMVAEIE